MATKDIRSRPGTASVAPLLENQDHPNQSKQNARGEFRLLCPFGIPATPEAAAVRVTQNVVYFGLFYTLVLVFGLSISLIPKRKLSLLLLIATTAITCSYLLLLRLLPRSSLMVRIIDRRLVLLLLAVLTIVELILTDAGKHLGLTMAIGAPVILVHACIRTRDDLMVKEEACSPGELFFLVEKRLSEDEPDAAVV